MGKACLEQPFAPWNAGATIFVHQYARFDARATLSQIRALWCDDVVCAADRLAHVRSAGLAFVSREIAGDCQGR